VQAGDQIAEIPLKIEGQPLAAGANAFGFLDGGRFLVTDLNGHDVLAVNSTAGSANHLLRSGISMLPP
jgi:hypothetical protein